MRKTLLITFSSITTLLLVITTSCHKSNKQESDPALKMNLSLQVTPETDSAYSLSWKDTLGTHAGLNIVDRPLEVWAIITDSNDTVGRYSGGNAPRDYEYFDTSDSVITIQFMIGENINSGVPSIERKLFHENHGMQLEFKPVVINLNRQLRKKLEFVLATE